MKESELNGLTGGGKDLIETLKDDIRKKINDKGYFNRNMEPLFGLDSYENQFDYGNVAKMYVLNTFKLPSAEQKSKDLFETEVTGRAKELEKDPYFRRLVRDYCVTIGKGTGRDFKDEEFVQKYEAFKTQMEQSTKMWSSIVTSVGDYSSQDRVEQLVKGEMEGIGSRCGDEMVYPPRYTKEAVDTIVCQTILSKGAKAYFYNGMAKSTEYEFNMKTGQKDIEKTVYSDQDLEKRIKIMRKQILDDPLFKETMAEEGMTVNKVYDSYKAKVKARINDKIRADKMTDKKFEKNKDEYGNYHSFLQDKNPIDDDTLKEIENLKKGLEEFNKGKEPSDLMKNLTTRLDTFIAKGGNGVDLYMLNKAALKYYEGRQGTFFSPVTGMGKARLGTVEKLIRITQPAMEKLNAEYKAQTAAKSAAAARGL